MPAFISLSLSISIQGKNSTYNSNSEYECLPCAEGCDYCEDGSPCIAALNWPMRTSILALACIVIGLLPPAAWFTFRYQQVKVSRVRVRLPARRPACLSNIPALLLKCPQWLYVVLSKDSSGGQQPKPLSLASC